MTINKDLNTWLGTKSALILGVSSPDYPPLDITINNSVYEGITADYTALISHLVGKPIEIKRFGSRNQAIQALERGQIDFLGSSNSYEQVNESLILTSAYLDDQPVLITKFGQERLAEGDLSGKRIAMVNHYLPTDDVHKFYPNASLQLFPSTTAALGAVVFGQADVLLASLTTSSYLASKSLFREVQPASFSAISTHNFSFAVRKSDFKLYQILNNAIQAIPPNEHMHIVRRWDVNSFYFFGEGKIRYTAAESAWLEDHPSIHVLIDGNFPPFTFNKNGKPKGLTIDILSEISKRTGLKFTYQIINDQNERIEYLSSQDSTIIGAQTPTFLHKDNILYSRPYTSNSSVLVVRKGEKINSSLLSNQTVSTARDSSVQSRIKNQHPHLNFIQTKTSEDSLKLVNNNEADVAIDFLLSADYLTYKKYKDLKIASTIEDTPEGLSFATPLKSKELLSILDKALLSIPEARIEELISNWTTPNKNDDQFWQRYQSEIIKFGIPIAILLLSSLGWSMYLQRQILQRRAAELKLNDQLHFMRELIDGTPNPIFVRDINAKLVTCNTAYLEELGATLEDIIGKGILEISNIEGVEGSSVSDYISDYRWVIEHNQPLLRDRQVKITSTKTVKYIYHWILPFHNSNGDIQGVIGGWLDISPRINLEKSLREAKDLAELANRAKTTFLATMSHEIRTPLNALIGMLEMSLKKAEAGHYDQLAIEVAYNASQGLLEVLGNVLDVVRIESGHLEIVPQSASLVDICISVANVFEGLAKQKGLYLKLQTDDALTTHVWTDPTRVKQVLSNLVGNAIKFTQKGGVTIVLSQKEFTKDRVTTNICVSDTGIGISEENQEKLFSPFSQVNSDPSSRKDGAGLGLAISRTLCELMGGDLSLSSTMGVGTTIRIELNLPAAPAPTSEPDTLSTGRNFPMRQIHALIVDDYLPNLMLLNNQLTYLGFRVSQAEDGIGGLRAWKQLRPDLIITDCNMPNLSGYEMSRMIRAQEQNEPTQVVIIGFTANAQNEERLQCLKSGMDDCLFKPIKLLDLAKKLEKHLSKVPELNVLEGENILVSDNHNLSDEVIKSLIETNEADLSKLHKLLKAKDLIEIRKIAHRIKGGAILSRSNSLVNALVSLENSCTPNASIETIGQLILNVEELIIDTNSHLIQYLRLRNS